MTDFAETLTSLSIDELKALRDKLEGEMIVAKGFQETKKVCLNSAYGVMGQPSFRFYDIRLVEAITMYGQLTIRWVTTGIDTYMTKLFGAAQYIIAGDTDSMYVNMNPLIMRAQAKAGTMTFEHRAKVLDKFAKSNITPWLSETFAELSSMTGSYVVRLSMKRESIAQKAIWHGKKHYIMAVKNGEGNVMYDKPKIVLKGISAVKSSTPRVVRDALKKGMEIILTGTEAQLIEHINQFRTEFDALPFTAIAMPRSVSDLEKYSDPNSIYIKGTPIAVRAALLYNHFIVKFGVADQHRMIRSGDKIKFCKLKRPNYLNSENVIAIHTDLPKEFRCDSMIDYDQQFEDTFLTPLKTFMNYIGWTVEGEVSLEDFL